MFAIYTLKRYDVETLVRVLDSIPLNSALPRTPYMAMESLSAQVFMTV